jgi:hypothetical protein
VVCHNLIHDIAGSYNRTAAGGRSFVLDFAVGQSFGEPQRQFAVAALYERRNLLN